MGEEVRREKEKRVREGIYLNRAVGSSEYKEASLVARASKSIKVREGGRGEQKGERERERENRGYGRLARCSLLVVGHCAGKLLLRLSDLRKSKQN